MGRKKSDEKPTQDPAEAKTETHTEAGTPAGGEGDTGGEGTPPSAELSANDDNGGAADAAPGAVDPDSGGDDGGDPIPDLPADEDGSDEVNLHLLDPYHKALLYSLGISDISLFAVTKTASLQDLRDMGNCLGAFYRQWPDAPADAGLNQISRALGMRLAPEEDPRRVGLAIEIFKVAVAGEVAIRKQDEDAAKLEAARAARPAREVRPEEIRQPVSGRQLRE